MLLRSSILSSAIQPLGMFFEQEGFAIGDQQIQAVFIIVIQDALDGFLAFGVAAVQDQQIAIPEAGIIDLTAHFEGIPFA